MYRFALAGNPNCGKTTLFNSLTGSTAHVGNWPGVTVDKKEGVYKIRLYAVDMLGKTAIFEYNLTVSINDAPVFIDEPILPKFFLEGYKYTLPTIPAYDYSSGTQKNQISTTIAIKDGKDGGQVRDLPGTEAEFEADADGYATIIYKATGAKGSNTAEYKVKVLDAWHDINSYTLDMKKYFYGENIVVTDSADSVPSSWAFVSASLIFSSRRSFFPFFSTGT